MNVFQRALAWFRGGAILTDGAVLKAMKKGDILIEPFDRACLGTNSYDVHLGSTIARYRKLYSSPRAIGSSEHVRSIEMLPLDVSVPAEVDYEEIPATGLVIRPGEFILGVTQEYTETHPPYVPWFDGKSSIGRLGLFVHVTAGRGDSGFQNHWTLEMAALVPLRIYPGMPIGQITYFLSVGKIINDYSKKASAKYNGRNTKPIPSQMWRNFKKVA